MRKKLSIAVLSVAAILVTGCADSTSTVSPVAPIVPASTQAVSVRISTSGSPSDLDSDGYFLLWDGGSGRVVGVQDSVSFSGLRAGQHTILLQGLAGNCKVTGDNPVRIDVEAVPGSIPISFSVSCTEKPTCTYCWDY
jgi:hypothetical protein